MNARRAISPIPTFIMLSLAWTYQQYLSYVVGTLLAIIAGIILVQSVRWIIRRTHNATFQEIDQMDGIEFEKYIARVLKINGYSHVKLTNTYDYGIDILARKDGVRWGIQVKRNRGQAS